jgi:hypothetical protein
MPLIPTSQSLSGTIWDYEMLFPYRIARRVNTAVVGLNVQGKLDGVLAVLKVFRLGIALKCGTLI